MHTECSDPFVHITLSWGRKQDVSLYESLFTEHNFECKLLLSFIVSYWSDNKVIQGFEILWLKVFLLFHFIDFEID
jgi:hypothetical protein